MCRAQITLSVRVLGRNEKGSYVFVIHSHGRNQLNFDHSPLIVFGDWSKSAGRKLHAKSSSMHSEVERDKERRVDKKVWRWFYGRLPGGIRD